MMKARLFLIVLLALTITGCAHKHNGYAGANAYYKSMMTKALSNPKWYNDYYAEPDPQKKRKLRNLLIEYCIWLVDNDFNEYVNKFNHTQTTVDLVGDFASLAFSGASAIANPAQLFGAISTGVQGAHSAYSKDVLNQQTREAILLKMSSLRQDRLLEIYKSELLPDDKYSLTQGLIDVQLYVNAGTVHEAVASISQDAASQHQRTNESLKLLRDNN